MGYQLEPPPDGFGTWEEALATWNIPPDRRDSVSAVIDSAGVLPWILFQRVPESKSAKNRLQVEVRAWSGDEPPSPEEHRGLVAAKVKALVDAGATVVGSVEENGFSWMVMQDPEGNEFCVT